MARRDVLSTHVVGLLGRQMEFWILHEIEITKISVQIWNLITLVFLEGKG